MQRISLERLSMNSHSFPAVGRYTQIWILNGRLGGANTTGRNDEEQTGTTDTNGSQHLFHRIIVPPDAFDFLNGSSRS